MRHIVEIQRSELPSDCFDLDYHIKNVVNHSIDTTNRTERFIYYYIADIVRQANGGKVNLGKLTYRLDNNVVYFIWEVL